MVFNKRQMANTSNTDFLGPLLKAINAIGKPATVGELEAKVEKMCQLSKEEFEPQDGTRTKLGYKLAWARTELRRIGFIESPSFRVWKLTPLGRKSVNLTSNEIKSLVNALNKKRKLLRFQSRGY